MEPLTWIPFFLYPEQLKLVAVYQIRSTIWPEWSIKRVPPKMVITPGVTLRYLKSLLR